MSFCDISTGFGDISGTIAVFYVMIRIIPQSISRKGWGIRVNIAICDDEELIREQMKELIQSQHIKCQIDDFDSGAELLAAGQFDIIFLDIHMDGMNGMETAKALKAREDPAVLVFITGLKEYVFDAFDVSAFHYLLKPVREEKFAAVFASAIEEARKRNKNKTEYLLIRTRSRCTKVLQPQILYIESRGRKALVHTIREVVEMYATMIRLEELLCEDFFRCHRSYYVNLAHIRGYNSNSLTLSNGEDIYLAKEKYQEFVKTYMRFLKEGPRN